MAEVFVGLGSNQGDSRVLLQRALARVGEVVPGKMSRVSSLYRTGPVGYTRQPDFLNAVALFQGEPLPEQWLQRLLAVEAELGRRRDGPRWGPRRLDLDLLAVDAWAMETTHLTLPHPRLRERRFVLTPWAEIASDFLLPDGERIHDLERGCLDEGRVELVEGPEWAEDSPESSQG